MPSSTRDTAFILGLCRERLLPGGAVQSGGRAAREVLLDALVVSNLGGYRDGGGLGTWGHNRGLS